MPKPDARAGARIAVRLSRYVEVALAGEDLTTAQFRMLAQLDEGPDVSSSLATKLAVSAPSVTNVVDGLVHRGLVERTHSAVDRRQVSLALTDEGRRALERADAAVAQRLTELLATTGDEHLLSTLAAFRPALDAAREARRQARLEREPVRP